MQYSASLALAATVFISVFLPFVSAHGHDHASDHDAVAEGLCEREDIGEYDMSMRIGSVFIILVTSGVGIYTPMALQRICPYSSGSALDWVLTVGKFFGTGVILATAFIHMLPAALDNFASPCLSEGWQSYSSFAGVFCMIASFGLQLLEMAAASHFDSLRQQREQSAIAGMETGSFEKAVVVDRTVDAGHVHGLGLLGGENEDDAHALKSIGTLILELGIAMHSVIIGITLANTDHDEFTTLLVAVVFHQFFEGIALGTRINEMRHKGWSRPFLLGLFFIVMTPIGVAIGIGIRSSFNPNSNSSILSSAILDSLSAGILLYNAYVTLMSQECTFNDQFRSAPFVRKLVSFLSMYLGAGIMALIGKWA